MKIVVIGAGVVGASIADALARRSAAVTVLDMRSPGRGASQASAGMLAPYTEAHGHSALLHLGVRSLHLFDAFVNGLQSDTGRTIEYARTGTLQVAMDDRDVDALRDVKAAIEHAGAVAEWMDAASLRAFEPCVAERAQAGIFTPAHGLVGVDALVRALVDRARLAGAIFESPVEAVGVDPLGSGVAVRTDHRRDDADAVVIATGSWSRRVRVANVPAIPIRPVRGQLLHLGWNAPTPPKRIVWGPRCYTVPWTNGSLLVGATVEEVGFEETTTVAAVNGLATAATELLPGVSSARFEGVRVGLRPATPDGLPAIGPLASAPRVVVATGHYRNGILLAPLTAEIVSAFLLDAKDDDAFRVTSPNRFFPSR